MLNSRCSVAVTLAGDNASRRKIEPIGSIGPIGLIGTYLLLLLFDFFSLFVAMQPCPLHQNMSRISVQQAGGADIHVILETPLFKCWALSEPDGPRLQHLT